MKTARRREAEVEAEPVRVLGRGLRAQRGVRLPLRVIREATGKTQTDVASVTKMDQADISRLEHRQDFDDCQLGTVRRYVEALGGKLQMVAVFGDKKIVISGTGGEPAAQQRKAAARPHSRRG